MANSEIREISGRHGGFIDQIKVRTVDGAQQENSPSFGGNGGGAYTWVVPAGEHIAKIIYKQGGWLDSLIFVTDKGSQSPKFGGDGGYGPFEFNLPVGARLNGIYGFKNNIIRGLGFTFSLDTVRQTPQFGTKNTGDAYSWAPTSMKSEIREIFARGGGFIDQFKVKTSDGSQEQTSPAIGGNGGAASSWKVPDGEYISKIIYKQGDWISGVTFVTNKGTQSPRFGGDGGQGPFEFNLKEGERLIGFYGLADDLVKGLGFYIGSGFKSIRKSNVHGNYNEGTKFEWKSDKLDVNLEKVLGNADEYIKKIKFVLTNGEESPFFGVEGGNPYDHKVPSGQHVTEVTFKTGNWLDSMNFKTSAGSTFMIGGGRSGCNEDTETIPEGANIVGCYGTYNEDHILSLGLILAQ